MEAKTWENDLTLFSEDLIADLFRRHPVLCTLPHKPYGPFIDAISKCVLLDWRDRRDALEETLNRDFPAFVETEDCFKQYLKRFADEEIKMERSAVYQILSIPSVLLEILFFLHRKGKADIVRDASSYLYFMLSHVKKEKFHEEGSWSRLASASAEEVEDYDEEKCRQYISRVCSIDASDEIENSSIDSNLECPIQTVTEKAFEPDGSVSHKSKVEISSADQKNSLIQVTEKHAEEFASTLKKPEDELEKDPTREEITPKEVKEKASQEAVSTLNKPEDELEKSQTSEEFTPEEKEISHEAVSTLNKPEDELEKSQTSEEFTPEEKEISHEAVSTLNKPEDELEKSQPSEEANLNEVADEKSPEFLSILDKSEDEPKSDSTNKLETPDEIKEKHSQEVILIVNKPEYEPKNDLPNKFAPNEEKLSPETVIASSETEEKPNKNSTKAGSPLSEAATEIQSTSLEQSNVLKEEPPIKFSSDLTDIVSNESTLELVKTDECLKAAKLSLLPTSVHQDVSESVSVSEKEFQLTDSSISIPQINYESLKEETFSAGEGKPAHCSSKSSESSLEEVDRFLIEEIATNVQVRYVSEEIEVRNLFPEDNVKKDCNVQVLKQDDNAIRRDPSSFKSPKHENKKATPNKAKTPSAEKGGVKDTGNKTAAFNQNQNVTPLKTQTGTPKSISSTGRNVTEEKTPKKFKSNSAASKSSSPCFKTPTDKEVSKIQPKSCEKIERSRNLLAAKASAEITKSSPKSASAASTKSRGGEFSDSSKPFPVVQPKLGEKDPLNNLRSSITSESSPKIKVTATDTPIASAKRKSTNSKSESCQKSASREKTPGSSSAKSTDQSEGKISKSSEETLDTKSCKESSDCLKKCDQSKGNEPTTAPAKTTISSTARRTRNVHDKSASSDTKSEKPRWR